jgi:hypothetical protein
LPQLGQSIAVLLKALRLNLVEPWRRLQRVSKQAVAELLLLLLLLLWLLWLGLTEEACTLLLRLLLLLTLSTKRTAE